MNLTVIDRGLEDYACTLAFQEMQVARRQQKHGNDTIILVEHRPVFTLGRRANTGDILLGKPDLDRLGIAVVETTRGGLVTYHGPGQLVVYPIIDLGARNRGPAWYVGRLEQAIVTCLAEFGVQATGDAQNRGVWVGQEKIAAIGVRITRGITMHGFAVNIAPDLTPFSYIVPCGIRDRGVTSLKALGVEISLDKVKSPIVQHLARSLATGLEP